MNGQQGTQFLWAAKPLTELPGQPQEAGVRSFTSSHQSLWVGLNRIYVVRNTKRHGFWVDAELSYGTVLIFFIFPLGDLQAQCQILVNMTRSVPKGRV